MIIELTPEQRQTVEKGEPVRLVDAVTRETLVLMKAEVYERLGGVLPRDAEEPPAGINPQMLRSMQAYWRDLPELLKVKRNRGRWVAYHGDERVGLGKTQTEMYQQCFRRGLQRGEFYVGKIETDPDGIPPWGTFQSDWSLYEVTEDEEEGAPPESV
jgi:hypothetical protein